MSIDSYVYVGVFLRVPEVRQTIKGAERRCSTPGCGHPPSHHARFCARCGGAVTLVATEHTATGQLDLDGLPPNLAERVRVAPYCNGERPNEAVLLPEDAGWGLTVDRTCVTAMSLDHNDPQELRERFAISYAPFIDYIRKTYGVSPVVSWGIVPYAC
jgi:hypothetical protein